MQCRPGLGDNQMAAKLPPGWEVKHSKSRDRDYYFNTATGQSQWDPPAAGESVGVYHLLVKHSGSRRPSSWREVNLQLYRVQTIQYM